MRSSSPSPSLSNVDRTHTSPLIQSAGLAENTFCDSPFTNVGTAGAGAGAAIATDADPEAASGSPGGRGRADAAVTPTSAIVAASAPAAIKRLLISIIPPPVSRLFDAKSAPRPRESQP